MLSKHGCGLRFGDGAENRQAHRQALEKSLEPSRALIEISVSRRGGRHAGTGFAECRRSDSNFAIVEIFRMQGGCTDFISQ